MSVFIIAEAGVNHNGSIKIAKDLINVAVESGADAVKFQTFKAEKLVSKTAEKADYQKKTTEASESQFDMLKKLELDVEAHQELLVYCQEKNIMFLSTPFDHDSINMLNDLGLETFKIPSGEITNLPYLRHVGSLNKKVVLSTGMSNLKEISDALTILTNAGTLNENITVLHANTMYPTPMEDVNLNAMQTIHKEFGVAVGYSDHTIGIEVDIAAVAMGASIIEKHFTLNKAMVSAIRNIEKALGSNEKILSPSEEVNLNIARKSIVASCPIRKGELLSEKNISTKRPGTGISPMKWDEIIGTIATKSYQMDESI
jgi:N,N'-diacetyllegionaminate synthase